LNSNVRSSKQSLEANKALLVPTLRRQLLVPTRQRGNAVSTAPASSFLLGPTLRRQLLVPTRQRGNAVSTAPASSFLLVPTLRRQLLVPTRQRGNAVCTAPAVLDGTVVLLVFKGGRWRVRTAFPRWRVGTRKWEEISRFLPTAKKLLEPLAD
jgi:hypothetical protein